LARLVKQGVEVSRLDNDVIRQRQHLTMLTAAPESPKSGPRPVNAWATLRKTCSGSGWPIAKRTSTNTWSVVRPWDTAL
jgi:hypothetical protein